MIAIPFSPSQPVLCDYIRTTMVGLPYEIWRYICSFLSPEEAWALYGLNHTLRDIALDVRYRCVKANFAPRNYTDYVRRFRHLSDGRISGRVRELHLVPYVPVDPFDFPGNHRTNEDSHSESAHPGDNDSEMLNTITRFTNLLHLRVASESTSGVQPLKQGLPLITGTLQAFSNHLRSLVLFFPMHMFPSIDFANIIFSRLESLEIGSPNLEVIYTTPVLYPFLTNVLESGAKGTILPFINRHSTLRSLVLALPHNQQAFTPFIRQPNHMAANHIINSIFEGIKYMPNLEAASFNTPTKLPRDHAIYRFLARHSKSLRSINICTANMSIVDINDFMDKVEMVIPHLQSLTFDFGFRSRSLIVDPSPAKFIRQFSSSLKTLKLQKKQHGRGEILSIFEFDPLCSVVFSKLLYLEMWIYCLTPDILDLFSLSLPNLEDLNLALRIFKGGDTSTGIKNERSQFCLEMKSREYADWRLKRLILRNFDSQRKTATNVDSIRAVVIALPNLLTINEVSRMDYLLGR